jgi:poly(3-hydroxybutyrate) depolymerase
VLAAKAGAVLTALVMAPVWAPSAASAQGTSKAPDASGASSAGGLTSLAKPCEVPSGLVADFSIDGVSLTYLIRVPQGAGPHTPMVVSMHGATGSAGGQQRVSGFDDNAESRSPLEAPVAESAAVEVRTMAALGETEGFIAVFPQARAELDYLWDVTPDSPDVQFVARLTEQLHAAGCSTPARTSVNGFSMGAMLTSRLMCVRPDLYSGAGMVGGALNPLAGCLIPPDRDILVVHGLRDSVVPFDGSLDAMLAELAGPESLSTVDRQGIAANWARAKDCPSPGWTTAGPNRLTDLTCPRSTTLAVVGESMGHTWDNPGLNTSNLIWAALRPQRPCTVQPVAPPNPTMAAALNRLIASDIAFRVNFQGLLTSLLSCNPHLHANVSHAIRAAIAVEPHGIVAQQMRFAIQEIARLSANGAVPVQP